MKSVDEHQAEAQFDELLAEVAAGASIEITKQGVPVARLVPIDEFDPKDAAASLEAWERYRDEHQVVLGGGVTIRELIEEGRR